MPESEDAAPIPDTTSSYRTFFGIGSSAAPSERPMPYWCRGRIG